MFFGAENGKYVGFIDGHEKVTVELRGKRAELYDLAKDPDELNNLAPARPTEVATLREDAVRFARAVQARIEAAPELSETLSVEQVYDLFMDHVVVSLRAKDGATTSCGTGRRAACGTAGPLMRAYTGTLQRDKRRCVMVKVPPAGELVLDVKDPDTLSLLSLTVAALPNDAGADARIKVTAVTDGERNTPVVVTRVLPAPRLEHPRPRQDFQLVLEQQPVAKPAPADSGVPAEPEPEREICVQLSGLVTD
jgi:hypothetical protein